jgi:alpha-tubulin suppressor-like RCC1 family protein
VISAGVGVAPADQASEPASAAAGRVATGKYHTCAVLGDGSVRCWGYGGYGTLGYGNTDSIGVSQTPASAGPVALGPGRKAVAISAGSYHTCAILDDGSVRCWGYGADGRLGYGSTKNVGALPTTTPDRAGPVDLGPGHTAKAISAGGAHTCAILDDGSVRCWGFGYQGQLGYGNTSTVGARPATTPGRVGPVDLGPGRTAVAISAGAYHTCAILDDGGVRCWGYGAYGQLGYGNVNNVGDTPGTIPAKVGNVNLGAGRTATAISAGGAHTCAILDDGSVRCWGDATYGQLGYGNTDTVGDDETPGSVRPVELGLGRTAVAINAGTYHTCVILDDGTVRCWGNGADGLLGYGNTNSAGDAPATIPSRLGPVNLGPARTAKAISAGDAHTCATLDDGTVRCWGYGADGELGYCNTSDVGDVAARLPGKVGAINLQAGDGGKPCARPGAGHPDPRRLERARARAMHRCLARVARQTRGLRSRARKACISRYGRTPGRIRILRVAAISSTKILLVFLAPGSDANNPPAARAYLVQQSRSPIRGVADLQQARTFCNGSCRFNVTAVDTRIELTIMHLAPRTTYYYSIAARDNVSGRLGPRSRTGSVRTR